MPTLDDFNRASEAMRRIGVRAIPVPSDVMEKQAWIHGLGERFDTLGTTLFGLALIAPDLSGCMLIWREEDEMPNTGWSLQATDTFVADLDALMEDTDSDE